MTGITVEVVGIHPQNKGAGLMLEAIIDRVRREFPSARIALPITYPVEERLRLGAYSSVPRERWRMDRGVLCDYFPERLTRAVGFVSPSKIDVLLDASGFGYGDYWGVEKLQRRLLRRLNGGRQAAILLPQALGPFTKPGMADAFVRALEHVDLAFVRDRQSLSHVDAIAPNRPNVRMAPDFTNLVHAPLPNRLAHLAGKSFVVPNHRVVGGNDREAYSSYVDFLQLAVERLKASGREVLILLHELGTDRKLADDLNNRLAAPVPVIEEDQPLVTKAIISGADVIVSSRFHGLVSALASAVPSLACGWSHKYAELMDDYGCRDLMVDVADRAQWTSKLDALLLAAASDEFRKRLRLAAEGERARSEAMWGEVVNVIRVKQKSFPH